MKNNKVVCRIRCPEYVFSGISKVFREIGLSRVTITGELRVGVIDDGQYEKREEEKTIIA